MGYFGSQKTEEQKLWEVTRPARLQCGELKSKIHATQSLTILSLLQRHRVRCGLKRQLLKLTGHCLALRARGQA